jgi:hypothetical protein
LREDFDFDFLSLLQRRGFPEKSGVVGEDCLSAQREFRSRPIFLENEGSPKGRCGRVAFFGLLCLAKQEK